MIDFYLLLKSQIIIPLICACVVFFIDKKLNEKSLNTLNVSSLSIGTSLLFSIYMLIGFKGGTEIHDFSYFGNDLKIGYDRFSLCFIFLVNLIFFFGLVSIRNRKISFVKESLGLILILQSFMISAIAVFDLKAFYTFLSMCFFVIFFIITFRNRHQQRLNIHRSLTLHMISLIIAFIAIIYISIKTGKTDLVSLKASGLHGISGDIIFFCLSLPLLIQMMVFPFHSWYMIINNLMTTTFRIIFSLVIILATYGFLRWILPIVPKSFDKYSYFMQILGAISFIFASSCMFYQKSLIKIANFFTISMSSFILIAIFSSKGNLIYPLMVMISSCFEIILFLEFISIIKNRFGTLKIEALSGIKAVIPNLNLFFIPLMLIYLNIPISIGFLGRFYALKNILNERASLAFLILLGFILLACSIIYLYRKIFLGKPLKEDLHLDMKYNEIIIFSVSLFIIYSLGLFPYILIEGMGL